MKKYIDNQIFKDSKAKEFIFAIENLRNDLDTLSVSELLQRIMLETGYEYYIRESGDMDRLDNITELLHSIVVQETEYGEHLSLTTFLQNISLLIDKDIDDKFDKIKIMTIHTAKGLEFNTVFIVGMSEHTFPSARALEERREEALEEERRLCFVAMTRAKKCLYLTESEGYGIKGYSKIPSRFLFDIDNKFIKRIGDISKEIIGEYNQITNKETDYDYVIYNVKDYVKHKVFGEGVIESVDENTKTYMIRFVNGLKPISYNYKGLSLVVGVKH